MNFNRYFKLVLMVPVCIWLSGCVSGLQGDTYTQKDARKVQTVRYATIEDVRMVVLEGNQSGVGGGAGALMGGLAGSSVGGGTGSNIAAVAGALAGGVLGNRAEEASSRKQGVELVVRLENSSQIIAVVQEYDEKETFHPGDTVRLMTINGVTRVAQ